MPIRARTCSEGKVEKRYTDGIDGDDLRPNVDHRGSQIVRRGLKQLEHIGEDADCEYSAYCPLSQRQEPAQDLQRSYSMQCAQ